MPQLKPDEILTRAEKFLQCAEYAAQSNLFNACAICSYAALFWATRAALAYEGFDRPTWGIVSCGQSSRKSLLRTENAIPRTLVAGFLMRSCYEMPRSMV